MELGHPSADARRFPCANEGNSQTNSNRALTASTTSPPRGHSTSEAREHGSTMSAEQTLQQLDQELSSDIPCDSSYCQENLHKGSHPADWFVSTTCPCGIWDWCNERFMIYTADTMKGEKTYCVIHGGNIEITWWKPVRIS